MLFDYLKIKKLLNSKEVSAASDLIYLKDGYKSNILITEKMLALEILKHPNFEVFAYQDKLKNRTTKSLSNIDAISEHFSNSPLLINGPMHIESRKKVIKMYDQIYKNISLWINQFTKDFMDGLTNQKIDPIVLVDHYIRLIFRKIFAENLNVDINQVPEIPGGILNYLIPQEKVVKRFNTKLTILDEFIKSRLNELNRPIDESWMLITIPIQGYETMLGSLVFGLVNHHKAKVLDEEKILREAAAVSLLTRRSVSNVEVNNIKFYKNQFVFISPFAVNLKSNFEAEKSIEFGFGKKLCPGKKLSLLIAKEFLTCFNNNSYLNIQNDAKNVKFDRLSMLTPIMVD